MTKYLSCWYNVYDGRVLQQYVLKLTNLYCFVVRDYSAVKFSPTEEKRKKSRTTLKKKNYFYYFHWTTVKYPLFNVHCQIFFLQKDINWFNIHTESHCAKIRIFFWKSNVQDDTVPHIKRNFSFQKKTFIKKKENTILFARAITSNRR